MNNSNPILRHVKSTCITILASLSCTPVQAQLSQPITLVKPQTSKFSEENKTMLLSADPLPSDTGTAQRTSGAGPRGCRGIASEPKPLEALIPIDGQGMTIDEHPTFWVYVPYKSPLAGKFLLYKDGVDDPIYAAPFTLTGKPGIVSIHVPTTAASLEVGKQYRWFFKIFCQSGQPPTSIKGGIQRKVLNSTIQNQLDKASPAQRVSLFADNGIWYNALKTAAELHSTGAKDSSWDTLLHSVQLDDLKTELIVDCCKLESK